MIKKAPSPPTTLISPHRAAFTYPLMLVGIVPIGCSAPTLENELSFRDGEEEGDTVDPTPGGTNCKGCAKAVPVPGDPPSLRLCVHNNAKYLGSARTPEDDVPIVSILQSTDSIWMIPGAPTSSEGEGDTTEGDCNPCFVNPPLPEPSVGRTEFFIDVQPKIDVNNDKEKTFQLTFLRIGNQVFQPPKTDFPSMTVQITKDTDYQCEPGDLIKGAVTNLSTAFEVPSDPALLPFLAHIAYESKSGGMRTCSGTVISANQVLTAAHCFWEKPSQLNDVSVVIGSWFPMEEGEPLAISGIKVHSGYKYDSEEMKNSAETDLAIVTLAEALPLEGLPFHVPQTFVGAPANCKKFSARGFGVRHESHPVTSHYDIGWLGKIPLKRVGHRCEDKDSTPTACIDSGLVLPVYKDGEYELCLGDSGGPVFSHCGTPALVAVIVGRVPEPSSNALKYVIPWMQPALGPRATAPSLGGSEIEIEPLHAGVSFNLGAALFGRRQEKVMERLAGQVCGVRVRDRRLAGWCR